MKVDIDGTPTGFAHTPVVGPRIVHNVPRLATELVERYRTAFVPDISDQVGQLYTMDSTIRPLYQPIRRLVGVALTVKTPPGDNLMIHMAMNMAEAGDVLVVDSRGYAECCGSGAGSLTPAIQRGLAGVVIDGAWRDVVELQALDFPMFGKGVSPYSPPKSRPGEINVPVSCGGVIVEAGDLIVCDVEGCVAVPREYAERVAEHLRDYRLAKSIDDWDIEQITRTTAERKKYEEALFIARGGVNVDWSDLPRRKTR